MSDKEQERYIRWQNYKINQLSFSINLFIGFSVASLAYVINLKLCGKVSLSQENLLFIIKVFSYSTIFGCLATVSRLLDFRYTARKIRKEDRVNSFMAKNLGSITWGMFWWQIITYIYGGYFFIFYIINMQ